MNELHELIILVSRQSQDDPTFDLAKLRSLLYFIDFQAYRERKAAITGTYYIHTPQGPQVKDFDQAVAVLEHEQIMSIAPAISLGYRQAQVTLHRDPNPEAFTEAERQIIHTVVKRFWGMHAEQVDEVARYDLGWRTTHDGERIPYQSAWLSAPPLKPEQIAAGLEIAQRHGLMGRRRAV